MSFANKKQKIMNKTLSANDLRLLLTNLNQSDDLEISIEDEGSGLYNITFATPEGVEGHWTDFTIRINLGTATHTHSSY